MPPAAVARTFMASCALQQGNIRYLQEQPAQAGEQGDAVAALGRVIDHHHDTVKKRIDWRAQFRKLAQHVHVAIVFRQRRNRGDRFFDVRVQFALGAGIEQCGVDAFGGIIRGLLEDVADALVRRGQRGRFGQFREFGDSTDENKVISAGISRNGMLNLRVYFPAFKETRGYGLMMQGDGMRTIYNHNEKKQYFIKNGRFTVDGKPAPLLHRCVDAGGQPNKAAAAAPG